MSEESNLIVAAEPSGEPTFADNGAVTLEGITFPPVESAPAEPVVAAEPATPQPVAPADPFAPTRLENGDLELRLETGEVFKGKTEMELLGNIAKSKLESNRYINELKSSKPAIPEPVAQPTSQQLDPATMAIADMLAPMFGAKSGQELAEGWQRMQQQQAQYNETIQGQREAAIAQQFVSANPDFTPTPANAEKIDAIMQAMNLPMTVDGLQLAHDALKGRGMYEAAPVAPPRTSTGQFAARPANPLPPNGSAPIQNSSKNVSESDMWAMPPEKLLELMQSVAQ